VSLWQGEQIVRIFAYWAIVYFEHFYENYRSGKNFWGSFAQYILKVLYLTKNGLDCIWAIFQKFVYSLVTLIEAGT
jgi:hypothetical protein